MYVQYRRNPPNTYERMQQSKPPVTSCWVYRGARMWLCNARGAATRHRAVAIYSRANDRLSPIKLLHLLPRRLSYHDLEHGGSRPHIARIDRDRDCHPILYVKVEKILPFKSWAVALINHKMLRTCWFIFMAILPFCRCRIFRGMVSAIWLEIIKEFRMYLLYTIIRSFNVWLSSYWKLKARVLTMCT